MQEVFAGPSFTIVYTPIRLVPHADSFQSLPSVVNPLADERSQDKKDDVKVGIRSTALLFGKNSHMILSGLAVSSASLISFAGHMNSQTLPFYCGVGIAAIQLARVIRRTDLDDRLSCWKGFVGCGWSGFWVFVGSLVDYIWSIL